MVLGVLLLASSLMLLIQNQHEDELAGDSSQELLLQLQAQIARSAGLEQEADNMLIWELPTEDAEATQAADGGTEPTQASSASQQGVSVVRIDSYEYMGYLSIPVLELELPVIAQWSVSGARTAPCRHGGSVESGDLVIAGHNYQRHFGRLKELQAGDLITFTQLDGTSTAYLVAEIKTVAGSDVEAVQNTEWPLILYTCTYGGKNRVLVCCERVA